MSRPKYPLTLINPDDFKFVVLSDGTTTSAEVIQRGPGAFGGVVEHQVGYGVARRRKGDRRDPDLGARLAMARALRSAAENIEKFIEADHADLA